MYASRPVGQVTVGPRDNSLPIISYTGVRIFLPFFFFPFPPVSSWLTSYSGSRDRPGKGSLGKFSVSCLASWQKLLPFTSIIRGCRIRRSSWLAFMALISTSPVGIFLLRQSPEYTQRDVRMMNTSNWSSREDMIPAGRTTGWRLCGRSQGCFGIWWVGVVRLALYRRFCLNLLLRWRVHDRLSVIYLDI